jgi:hypothetical protein
MNKTVGPMNKTVSPSKRKDWYGFYDMKRLQKKGTSRRTTALLAVGLLLNVGIMAKAIADAGGANQAVYYFNYYPLKGHVYYAAEDFPVGREYCVFLWQNNIVRCGVFAKPRNLL